ncbi:MAG TPA: nitroreductase family deazaflavin-dependent oxidoreductase [Mycobacterium sp.]|nr:nitroreductase family deazaflavin-dependent oxidoreductase [Mycobacterium sp.]
MRNPLQTLARLTWTYRLLLRFHRLIPPIERVLRRLSGGRIGVLDLVGLPSVQVTVPGRKTGVMRTTTLQYVPDGDALLLVASNWGAHNHPAWSANLMAAQQVSVRRRGEQFTAAVHTLTGPDRDLAWDKIIDFWPNYQIAQDLTGGRTFRVFKLTPIDALTD